MSILTTLISATPPTLPPGYCWGSPQKFANDLVSGIVFQLETDVGNSFFNAGEDVPSADNRIFPWLNADDGRWYQWSYVYGIWVSPYWWPAGPNGFRMDWEDSEANLKLIDGGNANAVSAFDGPFWEIDHNYDARSSMGAVATLPVSGNAFTVGTNFGEEKHALVTAELAAHSHEIKMGPFATSGGGQNPPLDSNGDRIPTTTASTQPAGSGTAHNTIHPVRANYKIKRTIRAFYTKGP